MIRAYYDLPGDAIRRKAQRRRKWRTGTGVVVALMVIVLLCSHRAGVF
jgi:hypothetical protein